MNLWWLLIAAAPLAGAVYQAIGLKLDQRRHPPSGRLVQSGKGRLHLHRTGRGSPAVLFEAGIAGTSVGWSLVQPEVGRFTTAVSYDRAGLGWSDACRAPVTLERMTGEVFSLLAQSGIAPPYILVGHSFGGLLVRAYAAARPEQVAGLVLVDPVSLAAWSQANAADLRRLALGVRLSRRGAWLARLGIVRAALVLLVSGSRFLPKLISRVTAGHGASVVDRLIGEVRRLPSDVWPAIQAHWSNQKCFLAMAAYLESLPASAEQALRVDLPPEIPVRILSATDATPLELEERDSWANRSRSGQHVRLESCGHWIQLAQPQAVVGAVRELKALNTGSGSSSPVESSPASSK